MFITQNFLAFSGWPDTRVLLALQCIVDIEKTNTLIYVPNALSIKMADKEDYFFASFLDRDQCYNLLSGMAKVAKRLVELHGSNSQVENRGLIFGFQSNFTSLTGNATASSIVNVFSNAAAGASSSITAIASSQSPSTAIPSTPPVKAIPATVESNAISSLSSIYNQAIKSLISAEVAGIADTSSAEFRTVENESPANRAHEGTSMPADVTDGSTLSFVFSRSDISILGEQVFTELEPSDLWKLFWSPSRGYKYVLSSHCFEMLIQL